MLDETLQELQTWQRDLNALRSDIIREGDYGKGLFLSQALGAINVAESAVRQARVMLEPVTDLVESIEREPLEVEQ
jgi:hypothetical protein